MPWPKFMEDGLSREKLLWEELPVELQDKIFNCLELNQIAGTARLICKAAAARYSGPRHTRIRLSQPVPAHAFAHRWGRPGAMRSLSYAERKQLLCLTAASGSIPNLQLLLPLVGCTLDSDVCAAAAAAGHLATCQWLRQQDCPYDCNVLKAAGCSGDRALCEWLIAAGCPGGGSSALSGAASAGHVGLVDELLASYGPPEEPDEVLVGAASGCDLPTLRRLHVALVPSEEGQSRLVESASFELTEAAASSASPDWRDKLDWLVAKGFFRSSLASLEAASCPDALDRLAWLAQRGWYVDPVYVSRRAATRGKMEVIRCVLEPQGGQGGLDAQAIAQARARHLGNRLVRSAACNGHLAVLQYLHGHGCSMVDACRGAAAYGHLHVVAWLVETLGAGAVLSEEVFAAAACSGSLPLLAWLRERGCVCRDSSVLTAARAVGCSEEALEWLLAQGWRVELGTADWIAPARLGDLAALAWLRRMGCPWAPDGRTFTAAVAARCSLPALRWLAEAGCPVDWAAALQEARARGPAPEAVAGLEELRGQQPGPP